MADLSLNRLMDSRPFYSVLHAAGQVSNCYKEKICANFDQKKRVLNVLSYKDFEILVSDTKYKFLCNLIFKGSSKSKLQKTKTCRRDGQ